MTTIVETGGSLGRAARAPRTSGDPMRTGRRLALRSAGQADSVRSKQRLMDCGEGTNESPSDFAPRFEPLDRAGGHDDREVRVLP